MLKGIHPLLGPAMLETIAAMGHGDVIAVVDRNFPATANARRLITLTNTTCDQAIEAILTLLPIDTFDTPATWRMGPVGDEDRALPVHEAVQAVLDAAEGRNVAMAPLERFEFYRKTSEAFAVVHTSEERPYGCFLLAKGVI